MPETTAGSESTHAGMNLVITMAGLGTRFRNAGYTIPKYMIEVRNRSLFDWSMDSIDDYVPHAHRLLFVSLAKDHASNFISERCSARGWNNIEILKLDTPTDGQATSCLLALSHADLDAPLTVFNIDTYVEPGCLAYSQLRGDGHIPCFKAPGTHWSFVRVDEDGQVTEVAEKRRISGNCSLGAYYFASASLFMDAYERDENARKNGEVVQRERFIAPLYNRLIEAGRSVTMSLVDSRMVHVLGTPNEVEAFRDSQSS